MFTSNRFHRMLTAAALWGMACAGFAQPTAPPEYRAMWISRFEWPNANQATAKANIDNMMETLKQNRFNAVLFQVRGQCDVHYPSPYEPWSNTYNWTDPGWDPLAYAIQAAHSRGLEFHAYINTHTLSQPVPPANTTPQHQYNLHGPNVPLAQSWLIRDTAGQTATSDNYAWISPGIPEASWWTRRAVMHIVENYDVDGVHFDRIRTPAPSYSYDPTTVARFNGDGNPDGLAWADFMRSQITRDLRNIYGEVQLVKPQVKVSAAPFGIVYKDATTSYQGTGTQSYHQWFQDRWGWMSNHCVDFMVPQIYWEVGSAHPFEQLLNDWQVRRGGRFVVAGSTTSGGTKSVSALLAEQAQTRTQGAAGHCIFSVGSMGNYWSAFSTGPYTEVAPIPDMPWKSAPTTGYIVGHVRDKTGAPVLDAKVNLSGDAKNYLSAYDGFYAILDVPTSTALDVSAAKTGKGSAKATSVTLSAGETIVVDLVLSLSAGRVEFDKAQYTFGETAQITLRDDDLEGSGTAEVLVASTTEPSGELVTLNETVTTGIFTGTISLISTGPVNPDGALKVSPGDTMAASYADADDGSGNPAVATDTAQVVAPPDIILESRTPAGGLTPPPAYAEFITTAGAWANTVAKSTAAGLTGSGGRWTGDNSLGAYTVWQPTIATPGLYDVYITLPSAANGPNNDSPGAGFLIQHDGEDLSGTFDLSRFNTEITAQWYLLAADVKFAAGGGASLRITNNNPTSANTGQRFDMDAVKFVYKGEAVTAAGTADLDKPVYAANDSAGITVTDADLQGSGTLAVTVASLAEPAGETVLLAEVGSSGIFTGSAQLSPGAPVAADGVVQVGTTDTITLTYDDADSGGGIPAVVTDTAQVDGMAPEISDVSIGNVGAVSAVVTFTTDEPTTGLVRYGTDCGALGSLAASAGFGTAHSVTVSGLTPGTTYSLVVEAADAPGNLSIADNGGACFEFVTQQIPVGLDEDFESGNPPWTGTGLWHVISTLTCSPAASAPNAWYYGQDSTCNYSNGATNVGSLLSPVFVVPPLGELTLSSREQTEGTGTTWDTRKIFVRPDGGGRTLLQQSTNNANAWYTIGPIDLSAYAGQLIQLEFEFNTVDSTLNAYLGWMVDDVLVAGADPLKVSPQGGLSAAGPPGGPFTPGSKVYDLTNLGTDAIDWVSSNPLVWASVEPTSGTLGVGETTTVTVSISAEATSLTAGDYTGSVEFVNLGTARAHSRLVTLTVMPPPLPPQLPDPEDGATTVPVFPLMSWSGGEGADSTDIYFGTTNPPPLFGTTDMNAFYPSANSYNLLDPDTQYFWRVNPKNAGGVTEGPVWSFTTVGRGPQDYFAELFNQNDFDLANQSLMFRPDASGNYYAVCRLTGVSSFPTVPTGGTVLALTDDSYAQVTLAAGKQVSLYGASHGSFFVGSNGYITFNSGDTNLFPHFFLHFDQPRIAALFNDLNPGTGAVTWRQLADRVAVTWQNVPLLGQTGNNSFQIEMFFDGTIRITWLGIAAQNALAGLSAGGGIPADFTESNLNSYGPCSVPAAPTNLQATSVTQTQIALAWTDNASDETTYTVERDSGGGFAPVAVFGPDANAHTDTGLPSDTPFSYRVFASNIWGNSGPAGPLSVATLPYPPAAPTGLGASAASQTQINLSWTDASDNESGFRIERDSGGGFAEIATVGAGVTAYPDTGLTANTPHSYRVRATNAGGDSDYSNTANATTLPNAPAAPTNLTVTATSSTQCELGWADNSANETGFEVERKVGDGAFAHAVTASAGTTGGPDTGLQPATLYTYRVRALNTGGPSAWSNEASAITQLYADFIDTNEGWYLVGQQNQFISGDHDTTHGALRLTVKPSAASRTLGWRSPNLPFSNMGGNTVYRFKAWVFRSGQANPSNLYQIPNMRLRCAIRYSVNSMLEVFFHNPYDPTMNAIMAQNAPSTDPTSPTMYQVDLDPVDVPYLTGGAHPEEGVSGMIEAYCLEPQENGSIELAEAVLSAYPAPPGAAVTPLKTYATSASDAGDLWNALSVASTVNGSLPVPVIDDSTTYGLTLDSTDCATTDIATAVVEFDPGAALPQRVRVEAGRMYRLRWHVASGRPVDQQSQMRMRARTIRFSWTHKVEIGGAWPTYNPASIAIAQQSLPGVGTMNPDKMGNEVPGVWDGGWYTMYFHPPVSVPAGEPGPGVNAPSLRDLKCGFDLLDTISNGPNAAQEGGFFAVDRIEVGELDAAGD